MWKNKSQVTRLLTKKERDELLVLPRMHITLLLDGNFDLNYLHSVAGMFNVAIALATLRRRENATAEFNRVQDLMANLIFQSRLPEGEERGQILAALDAAERLIALETRQNILKAVAYVDRCITEGRVHTPQQRSAGGGAGVMNF